MIDRIDWISSCSSVSFSDRCASTCRGWWPTRVASSWAGRSPPGSRPSTAWSGFCACCPRSRASMIFSPGCASSTPAGAPVRARRSCSCPSGRPASRTSSRTRRGSRAGRRSREPGSSSSSTGMRGRRSATTSRCWGSVAGDLILHGTEQMVPYRIESELPLAKLLLRLSLVRAERRETGALLPDGPLYVTARRGLGPVLAGYLHRAASARGRRRRPATGCARRPRCARARPPAPSRRPNRSGCSASSGCPRACTGC